MSKLRRYGEGKGGENDGAGEHRMGRMQAGGKRFLGGVSVRRQGHSGITLTKMPSGRVALPRRNGWCRRG